MVDNNTLKEFSNFLSQLAERSEYVYWLSSPDLESIQYISPAYEKIWGRKLQELYDDPEKWITFLHPEDAEHHHPIHVMKERIKNLGPEAKYNEDYRIMRPDGEVRWIMDRGFPIYDPQGNCLGVTGVALDVTKEKEAELKLAKAKIQAEAANRAKTEFLANMSHDVKTPLSGVIGMAELISHDSTGKEKHRGEAIHSCGMQLLSFFNSCLELSKLEMIEWAAAEENFSLETLLKQIYDLLAPTAEIKGLKFSIEIDPSLPLAIRGHHSSIYRIMLNLTGNALKFTKTGSVQLRAFLSEKIETSKSQIQVGLEVKDTGIGIPEDQHEVIFEKLKRLTPSYEGKVEGSGIGLYIVDQYVKRMNGEVLVESAPGKGSTFTVILPMSVASDTSVEKLKPIEPPSIAPSISFKQTPNENKETLPTNAPRILLVEDNPLIQHVTEALLNGAGFSVDIASTGAEALEKFLPGKYGLVYMDIGLPDQDGYSVAHAIREKEKSLATPIIALTAHGALDVERFCSRAGMQGVLSKPLTREQATSVWERYGLGKSEKVNGLTIIENSDATPDITKIIDIKSTAALLGSQKRAEELLTLWFEMLTQRFLPALQDLMSKNDIEGMRHELHAMLGSLCYVKTPLLNQAVLELQTATRSHPQEIENTYQQVIQESQRFVEQYQQLKKNR